MPTPDDFDFSGLDEARPLPPGLADRLEAALLAAAGDPEAALFASLDDPRPLSPELTSRLETAVLSGMNAHPPVQGAESAHTSVFHRPVLLAVAAVIALILGSVAVLNRGGGDQDVTASAPEAATDEEAEAAPTAPSGGATAPAVPEATPAPVPPLPPAPAAAPSTAARKRAAAAPESAPAPAGAPAPTASWPHCRRPRRSPRPLQCSGARGGRVSPTRQRLGPGLHRLRLVAPGLPAVG